MEYDEIRITTRREINICKDRIKKLEKSIAYMEKKYLKSDANLSSDLEAACNPVSNGRQRLKENMLALARWQERLQEYLKIMNM